MSQKGENGEQIREWIDSSSLLFWFWRKTEIIWKKNK